MKREIGEKWRLVAFSNLKDWNNCFARNSDTCAKLRNKSPEVDKLKNIVGKNITVYNKIRVMTNAESITKSVDDLKKIGYALRALLDYETKLLETLNEKECRTVEDENYARKVQEKDFSNSLVPKKKQQIDHCAQQKARSKLEMKVGFSIFFALLRLKLSDKRYFAQVLGILDGYGFDISECSMDPSLSGDNVDKIMNKFFNLGQRSKVLHTKKVNGVMTSLLNITEVSTEELQQINKDITLNTQATQEEYQNALDSKNIFDFVSKESLKYINAIRDNIYEIISTFFHTKKIFVNEAEVPPQLLELLKLELSKIDYSALREKFSSDPKQVSESLTSKIGLDLQYGIGKFGKNGDFLFGKLISIVSQNPQMFVRFSTDFFLDENYCEQVTNKVLKCYNETNAKVNTEFESDQVSATSSTVEK